ncbi:MAG: RNA polymerase sigma-70 factor [Bacteroidota bacterium]
MAQQSGKHNYNLLWDRVAANDIDAFKILFDAFYEELVSYSHRLTQQLVISEEIVQEVFISLWDRRSQIKISSSVNAYLYRAVKNRTINYLKNQLPKDQATTDLETANELEDQAANAESDSGLETALNQAIEALPEKCRVIFLLSRNEGLTHKEIAEELSLSPKTVENQIGIAIKKLRTTLKPYLGMIMVCITLKIVSLLLWGY